MRTRRFLNFVTLNWQNKHRDDIGDLVKNLTRCMGWDAIALQEVRRGNADAGDATIRSPEGHMHFTSRRNAVGTRAAAVAVHRRWAATVQQAEHAPHITKVTRRVRRGGQQSETDLALISLHMPSLIRHCLEDLDTAVHSIGRGMPGKRVMCMIGADLNTELMDPQKNDRDDRIGAALTRRDHDQLSDHREMMRSFVRGSGLRLHTTFNKWWKRIRTDDYPDGDNGDDRRPATTSTTATHRFTSLLPSTDVGPG